MNGDAHDFLGLPARVDLYRYHARNRERPYFSSLLRKEISI